jgi:hypothetical protein
MEELDKTWHIDDDYKADVAIEWLAEEKADTERRIDVARKKIEQMQEFIDKLTAELEEKTQEVTVSLQRYFETVSAKETKTQLSYKLVHGSLVMKKPSVKLEHDDDKLLVFLHETGGEDFIKVTEKVAWAEYKKLVNVVDGAAVDSDTGEVIDGVTVVEAPAEFTIKFAKEN